MKAHLGKEVIAIRAAKELKDGDVVNLGTGIPSLLPNYIPPDVEVIYHAENGAINYGELLTENETDKIDTDYVLPGGHYFLPRPGLCLCDHHISFVLARGGRLDACITGALEVSEKGDLANWSVDMESRVGGIGGAMDIIYGARRVIITMTHVTSLGEPKILRNCRLPLTGAGCVDTIITDLAVIDVINDGLLLREIAPGWSIEEVQAITEPRLVISHDLVEMKL